MNMSVEERLKAEWQKRAMGELTRASVWSASSLLALLRAAGVGERKSAGKPGRTPNAPR